METLRVLVIDDELGMRLAVERTLQGYSVQLPDVEGEVKFSVEMAGSGEEGLDSILANPPDVVLLDHKLPGISGLEVLNNLADRNLDLLVVMITAYASLETAIIATKRGAYDFLAKPFTPGELKAATRKAARHLILQRQARQLAEEKKQVRFQFLSVLAHELKAPLAAVQGYLYIMRDKSLGEELPAYDKIIERSLIRIDGMRKMILDLLDLTRIESGTKKREVTTVNLMEMAQLSMETMIPMAQEHSITMNLLCDAPINLTADRSEMEIVFNNLVSNAVKYNRDGGKVDVTIRPIENGAVVSVSDTGIGMSQEETARLFKEFVRIKNSKTKNVMGSGLGLSIVKKLANAYDGDVVVESVADVGTTFTVTLKNAPEDPTVTLGNSSGEGRLRLGLNELPFKKGKTMSPLPSMELSRNGIDFINDSYLLSLLEGPVNPTQVREIIAKAMDKQALSTEETAVLLRVTEPELVEEIFTAARELKRRVYGNRIVLFAPLYVGNDCVNDCAYCAFRRSNRTTIRRTLTDDDVRKQVVALENQGHKRLILVFGEHQRYDAQFIADTVRSVYDVKVGHGAIRRVNINAAPLDVEGYKIVKASGIGTYQIFHETYHHETFAAMHPANTRKGNYLYRLDGLSRAQEGGIDDVGLGALFGLYDWRFEVLGLVTHALFLQKHYGVGPHTISFPRIQPAHGVNLDPKYMVSDYNFKRVVATLRLAVPYTGLILTARESAALRREVMSFGVSQIDAGTRLELGGYTEAGDSQVMEREQFQLGDIRSLDQVMRELLEDGYVPSFCTSCYRLGRTGEHFMEFAIPGFIKRFCTPNALTTLQEYLMDYSSPETRAAGERMIDEELAKLEDGELKNTLLKRLEEIRNTEKRDSYF